MRFELEIIVNELVQRTQETACLGPQCQRLVRVSRLLNDSFEFILRDSRDDLGETKGTIVDQITQYS